MWLKVDSSPITSKKPKYNALIYASKFCFIFVSNFNLRRYSVDVANPNCAMLATHDDYSLVERFAQQPRIVTMLRDPVARFLSSYEFAVEVSLVSRYFAHSPNKLIPGYYI
jgi:hypothetical protein